MIVIVAPEPSFWLAPLLEIAASVSERTFVIAPWALGRKSPVWLPSFIEAFWNRRFFAPPHSEIQKSPSSFFLEAALRFWAGQKTHRRMETRFLIRKGADELASRSLPSTAKIVIAPSCAAEKTFAAAAKRRIKTILLEDLPAIRQLQEDLDRAAQAHPSCVFLKRYRASPLWIVRQERERVLANLFLVRGHFAHSLRENLGISKKLLFRLPTHPLPPHTPPEQKPANPLRILLAGLATARNGVMEALTILPERPSLKLLVRKGEGMEPKDLLRYPQVIEASPEDLSLKNVDLVIAPAWCESYPPEIPLAASKGIPMIATPKACGFVDLWAGGEEIRPGDSAELGNAVDRLLFSKGKISKNLPAEISSDFAKALGDLLQKGRESGMGR